ncbi:MAG: hypothetical protein EA398_17020 [Deltaproteobacteria bacterium]|nr:MAG: hypothetical protein EA398_17020 [Deltaproteobacteria bacterium]
MRWPLPHLLTLLITLVVPPVAPGTTGQAHADEPPEGFFIRTSAGAAYLDEDWFARLSLSLLVQRDNLLTLDRPGWTEGPESLGLRVHSWVPLHLRLGAEDGEAVVREEDWDEIGDWFRLLRVVELGQPGASLHVRAGELAQVRVGHGTLVDHFINTLQLDHFQWGIHATADAVAWGGEVLVDSVTDPALIGARGLVRPLAFADPTDPVARRFAVGGSLFVDPTTPARLSIDDDGLYIVDDRRRLAVDEREATASLGVDAEFTAVRTDTVGLTAYLDGNLHAGRGAGLHAGLFFDVRPVDGLHLHARGEFRRMGRDYLATPFGPLHAVHRLAYRPVRTDAPDASTQRRPRLEWLRGEGVGARNGWLAEGGVDLHGWFRLLASWEDGEAEVDTALRLRAEVDPPWPVLLGFFLARDGFDPADGVLSLDDTLLVSEARLFPLPWLHVGGELSRRWLIRPDGTAEPATDYAVLVGLTLGL